MYLYWQYLEVILFSESQTKIEEHLVEAASVFLDATH